MKFTFAVISSILVGASAQNLRQGKELGRGQMRPQQLPDNIPGGRHAGRLPNTFFGGFPGGRPGGDRPEGSRPNGAGDLLDNFNISDGLGDFLDRFNFTGGDMMPPCPPDGLLDHFNITAEDLECDPDFDFSDLVGNFSDSIPCPPQHILDHFNKSVGDLPCNPEIEFPESNFTGDKLPCPPEALLDLLNMTVDDFPCNPDIELPGMGNFSIDDLTDKIPCPPQEMLDRFNITQDDLPCNPDLEFPNRPIFERPNRTVLNCEEEEPVACGLGGGLFNSNRVGVVVCREKVSFFGGEPTSSRCIEADRARDSDICGCCGGECPQTCSCGCIADDGEAGFLVENRFGWSHCVSAEQSVTFQLGGRYTCVEEGDQCLPPTPP